MRPYGFAYVRTELRRRLADLALRGVKTATSDVREDFQPFTDEPLSRVGERCVLVGFDDEPLGIIEITSIDILRMADVDLQFAIDEGEGYETVAAWRAAHERFWAPRVITDDTLIVCERFRLV
jgi:uncharacterized protein YhfF